MIFKMNIRLSDESGKDSTASGPPSNRKLRQMTHSAVTLAAAVAVPDKVYGERVCVELHPGASLDLKTLVAHLAQRGVSKETRPERLAVFPKLPRNPGGRVAKNQLREEMASRVAEQEKANQSSTYLVPTLPGTNASGKLAARAWMARHPVQCTGATTRGSSLRNASTVAGMIGSKSGPPRWKPPTTAYT